MTIIADELRNRSFKLLILWFFAMFIFLVQELFSFVGYVLLECKLRNY